MAVFASTEAGVTTYTAEGAALNAGFTAAANLYIAHQQGLSGFVALFNAPSDDLAGKVLSQFKKTETLGFQSVAKNLNGNEVQQADKAKTMTAGEFLSFLSNSFNSKRLPK